MPKQLNNEIFLKRCKEKNLLEHIEPISAYVKMEEKIKMKCKKCNYEWSVLPDNILRGKGCPSCAGNARVTEEDMKTLTKEKYKNFEFIKFENKKVTLKCKDCKKEIVREYRTLKKTISKCDCELHNLKITNEKFTIALKRKKIIALENYKNSNQKIKVQCETCGHMWKTRAASVYKRTGCPKCNGGIAITQEEFENRLKDKKLNFEVVGKYEKDKRKIKTICKFCGKTRYLVSQSIYKNTKCSCQTSNVSIKEKELNEKIKSYGFKTIENKRDENYDNEIDIFLPELNIGFEYNGLYWHSEKFRDKNYHDNKLDFWKKKGIQIFNIYESEKKEKEIETILNKLKTPKETSLKKNKKTIKILEDGKRIGTYFYVETNEHLLIKKVEINKEYMQNFLDLEKLKTITKKKIYIYVDSGFDMFHQHSFEKQYLSKKDNIMFYKGIQILKEEKEKSKRIFRNKMAFKKI